MKRSIAACTLAFFAVAAPATAETELAGPRDMVSFLLRWKMKDLPLKVRVFKAPYDPKFNNWQMGEVKKIGELGLEIEYKNGEIPVPNGNAARLFMVIENPTKKAYRFAAAPHETNPIEHSLGFKFDCLCNGHVYSIGPGSTWYRLITIATYPGHQAKKVELTHTVFAVKDSPKK